MRCVIYARYSSDGQREESIEGQLRECKEFADRHNMTIISRQTCPTARDKREERKEKREKRKCR